MKIKWYLWNVKYVNIRIRDRATRRAPRNTSGAINVIITYRNETPRQCIYTTKTRLTEKVLPDEYRSDKSKRVFRTHNREEISSLPTVVQSGRKQFLASARLELTRTPSKFKYLPFNLHPVLMWSPARTSPHATYVSVSCNWARVFV